MPLGKSSHNWSSKDKNRWKNTIPSDITPYWVLSSFYQNPKTVNAVRIIMQNLWKNLDNPHISNSVDSKVTAFDIPFLPYWTNDKDGIILQNLCHHDISRFKRNKEGDFEPTPEWLIYINDKLQFTQRLREERMWDYVDQTNGFKKDRLTQLHWMLYMVHPFKKNVPWITFNKKWNIVLRQPSDYNLFMETLTSTSRPNGTVKSKVEREMHANFLRQIHITAESQIPQLQNKEKIFYHIVKNIFPWIDSQEIKVEKALKSFKVYVNQEVDILLSSWRKIKAHIYASPKENNSNRKKMSSKSEYDSAASIGDNQRAEVIFQRDVDQIEYAIDFFNNLPENNIFFDPTTSFSEEVLEENPKIKENYKLVVKNKKFTSQDKTKFENIPDSYGKSLMITALWEDDRHGRSDKKYKDFKATVPLKVMGSIMLSEFKFTTEEDSQHRSTTRHTHYNSKRLVEILCREVSHHGISEHQIEIIVNNCLAIDPRLIQEAWGDNKEAATKVLVDDIKKSYYAVVLYNDVRKKYEKLYMNKERIDTYIKNHLFPPIETAKDKSLDYLKSHSGEDLYKVSDM